MAKKFEIQEKYKYKSDDQLKEEAKQRSDYYKFLAETLRNCPNTLIENCVDVTEYPLINRKDRSRALMSNLHESRNDWWKNEILVPIKEEGKSFKLDSSDFDYSDNWVADEIESCRGRVYIRKALVDDNADILRIIMTHLFEKVTSWEYIPHSNSFQFTGCSELFDVLDDGDIPKDYSIDSELEIFDDGTKEISLKVNGIEFYSYEEGYV